jgi:hypothetical protein
MASFNDFRIRADALRRLAEAARGEGIRADLAHLADRFDMLAETLEREERQSDARDAPSHSRMMGR